MYVFLEKHFKLRYNLVKVHILSVSISFLLVKCFLNFKIVYACLFTSKGNILQCISILKNNTAGIHNWLVYIMVISYISLILLLSENV